MQRTNVGVPAMQTSGRWLVRALVLAVFLLLAHGGMTQTAWAKVVLEFAHWDANPGIEKTWELFNASQDEIEIVYRALPWEAYLESVLLEMATGAGPDLFSLMGWETAAMNFRVLMRDGLLVDLTPYLERDRDEIGVSEWFPFIIPLASYQGKLAGLPYGWSVFNAINYNADLFDAAGVAYPDDTWTWETLFDASKKFIRADGEGNIVTRGLAPGDLSWWAAEAMVWSAGGQVFNDEQTGLALSAPAARTALDRAAQFVIEGAAVDGGAGWGSPASSVAFRLAPLHWATVDKPQYGVVYRTGLAPTPKDPVTGQRIGNSVEIMLTAVNANTKHSDAAWKALKFFTENFGRASLEGWGMIQFTPVSPSGLEAFLRQGADVLGDPFATDLLTVVPTMAATARLPEEAVNPVLVDIYPEIKNLLANEWGKVIDPSQRVPVYQFIETVSRNVQSRLAGGE